MEYVEFEEWKKFKKEKNYKESIDILIDEIATNLVRVHNHYSDVKYDEKKELGIAFNYLDYGKNSKNKSINDMKLFIDFCEKNKMMYKIDEIFAYLHYFPQNEQLSLF